MVLMLALIEGAASIAAGACLDEIMGSKAGQPVGVPDAGFQVCYGWPKTSGKIACWG